MKLDDLLRADRVFYVSSVSSKKKLLQSMAEYISGDVGTPAPVLLERLTAREQLGSTGVGHGVAIPHARLSRIEKVQGAFMVLGQPVEYDAIDGQPIDIVFLLVAPEKDSTDHLKAMALVSRILRNKKNCEVLRDTKSPSALFGLLQKMAL